MKLRLLILFNIALLMHVNARAQNKYAPKTPLIDSGKVFNFVDMRDINSELIKASALKGKTVVFNFWFIACPPCRYEIPELDKLAKEFSGNKDVVFLAISTDNKNEVRKFIRTNPFGYRHVANGKPVARSYGIHRYPMSLVIDTNGVVVFNSKNYGVASVPGRLKDILQNLTHKKSSP